MSRVLIACESSAVVRDAFRARGHDAYSCDLLPCEGDPQWHFQEDCRLTIKRMRWDILIHHTPCTYATNAGARWLYTGGRGNVRDPERWENMVSGAALFRDMHTADVPVIVGENPIPHSYALALMGPYTQIIQPWMFGHWETKATCLWIKGAEPLVPTYATKDACRIALGLPEGSKPVPRVHFASPGPDRWKERSRTLTGIADALATQIGGT